MAFDVSKVKLGRRGTLAVGGYPPTAHPILHLNYEGNSSDLVVSSALTTYLKTLGVVAGDMLLLECNAGVKYTFGFVLAKVNDLEFNVPALAPLT